MKTQPLPLSEKEERVATAIVESAFAVHSTLGPGLLESIYRPCFCHELSKRVIKVVTEVTVPIVYDGLKFAEGLRLDVLADDLVICELKAVEGFHPVHTAQLLTYLKLTDKRLGFLINFNVALIKHGLKRVVR